MTDFEWEPEPYLETIREEVPGYEELQNAVAAAARGTNVLELGTGTGETALRILARNVRPDLAVITARKRGRRSPSRIRAGSRGGRATSRARCGRSGG